MRFLLENVRWIAPKEKKALRWATGSGFGYSKGHFVSGIRENQYLYDSLRNIGTYIDNLVGEAING